MSFSPLAKVAFRIGALVIAVGMLGGYLWMTQRELPKAEANGTPATSPSPEFDPRVTSKSAAVIDWEPDPNPAASSTPNISITSKSFQVVTPQTVDELKVDPRVSSKMGTVFSPAKLSDPNGQPVLKNEEEEELGESLLDSPTPAQPNAPAKP